MARHLWNELPIIKTMKILIPFICSIPNKYSKFMSPKYVIVIVTNTKFKNCQRTTKIFIWRVVIKYGWLLQQTNTIYNTMCVWSHYLTCRKIKDSTEDWSWGNHGSLDFITLNTCTWWAWKLCSAKRMNHPEIAYQ